MSTFDTLCDWKDGEVSDLTALTECIQNLGFWSDGVQDYEAFEAICEIVSHMTDGKWKYRRQT